MAKGTVTYLDNTPRHANIAAMNLISLLIGLVTLPAALLAFLPFLGWMYWLIVPVAIVGFVLGLLSRHNAGRALNLVVILVGITRLWLGFGII